MTRSAGAAIAAVLALASTPVLAQDAPATVSQPSAPPVLAPVPPQSTTTAAPPVAQPVPGSPMTSTGVANNAGATQSPRVAMESRPVVQKIPESAQEEPAAEAPADEPVAAAPAESAEASTPATPEPVAVAAPEANEDSAVAPPEDVGTGDPLGEFTAGTTQGAPAVVPAESDVASIAESDADTNEFGSTLAQIAAVLAALGLGGWALMALRRRKTDTRPAPRQELAVAAPPASNVDPAHATNSVGTPTTAYDRTADAASKRVDGNGNADTMGAAVPLPRSLPESYEERDALLRRMVAAKPDRANPFLSPRARIRRARLIMQSLGRRFDREPLIDLSQYPNNWPELTSNDYAAAA